MTVESVDDSVWAALEQAEENAETGAVVMHIRQAMSIHQAQAHLEGVDD